jgi:hypothetical protein
MAAHKALDSEPPLVYARNPKGSGEPLPLRVFYYTATPYQDFLALHSYYSVD